MRSSIKTLIALTIIVLLSGCSGSDDPDQAIDIAALKISLGQAIFEDAGLSEPAGQACADCHQAGAGFADPNVSSATPVSEGVVSGQFGNRNAPTAAYASFTPEFHYDNLEREYIGGQFVDGRATNLVAQAKGPFLNPVEMANTSEIMVVEKIRSASYASIFRQVYGADSLEDVGEAYNNIADAIAAFEATELFSPFNSKFDAYLAGSYTLSTAEANGFDIFQNKALCTECHVLKEGTQPLQAGDQPLFTNFTYSNIGTPKNPDNPVYDSDPSFIDTGLAANPNLNTSTSLERGKFRVPTLRNVELTAPYFHNGVLQTLEEVVSFYNTREPDQCWGAMGEIPLVNCWPEYEVSENVDISSTGDLLLTEQEEADLVAFLKTLTDGYSN